MTFARASVRAPIPKEGPKKLDLRQLKGRCKGIFAKLG